MISPLALQNLKISSIQTAACPIRSGSIVLRKIVSATVFAFLAASHPFPSLPFQILLFNFPLPLPHFNQMKWNSNTIKARNSFHLPVETYLLVWRHTHTHTQKNLGIFQTLKKDIILQFAASCFWKIIGGRGKSCGEGEIASCYGTLRSCKQSKDGTHLVNYQDNEKFKRRSDEKCDHMLHKLLLHLIR